MLSQNEAQFREWVQEYSDQLYHFCIRRGFDEAAAQDLVQETFLAAWRNMERYKGEASVRNWLFVILKSKIADHFRTAANKVVLNTLREENADHRFFDAEDHWEKSAYPKNWNVDFENKTEVKEFYSVFRKCGSKLKEIQNAVFVMKYIDGMESEEICKFLDISSSNYWVIIHRAKVQLRACLQKNWMDQ